MKLQQVIINQLSDFKPKLYHSDRIAWIEDMEETNEDCLVSLFLSLKCMAANHPVAVFRARAVKSLGKVLFAELRQQAGMQ